MGSTRPDPARPRRAGAAVASRAGHRPPPAPAPVPPTAPAVTTVSGRSVAPVGPVWISVPMAGQTPQSIARRPAAVLHLGGPGRVHRVLPVLPEPVAVQPGVQVIPRQHLAVLPLAGGVPVQVHRGWPASASAAARCQRSKEKCSLQPSNRAPSAHAALITAATRRSPARQQALDDRRLAVVVPVADRLAVAGVGAQRAAERPQPGVHRLVVALGGPLERRVRLGHEPADRHRAADVAAAGRLPARLDHLPGRDPRWPARPRRSRWAGRT